MSNLKPTPEQLEAAVNAVTKAITPLAQQAARVAGTNMVSTVRYYPDGRVEVFQELPSEVMGRLQSINNNIIEVAETIFKTELEDRCPSPKNQP